MVKKYLNKEGKVVMLDASHLPLSHFRELREVPEAKMPDVLKEAKATKKPVKKTAK